jgi:chromate reductase
MSLVDDVRLLLVSGSTRFASTNTAALRTAQQLVPPGVRAELYSGLSELPAFNPDADDADPHPAVRDLRAALAAADAVLFCTPEYAGTLPGSLKNLLDWTVGTGELYEKPVGWVSVANPGRGEGATATLRLVLGYVSAVEIDGAGQRVPVGRDALGPDGLVSDVTARAALAAVLSAMAAHVRAHRPA